MQLIAANSTPKNQPGSEYTTPRINRLGDGKQTARDAPTSNVSQLEELNSSVISIKSNRKYSSSKKAGDLPPMS